TLNTPGALSIIAELRKDFEGKLNIGAGTVCTLADLEKALAAGAQFIVSPIIEPSLMAACREREIPFFPGALTPSEIYQASQAGARMVKVFPAGAMGPSYIKDVLAPLDQLLLMPTGGVTLKNIGEYWQAGARAFGLGGNLFKKDLIQQARWQELAGHFWRFKQALREAQK
ncbi:MAG: bifunctional 4-hydroxy-2-oxoglutarate aldolase/2-dehydro-3-deoxy-phosphogluconate aldolase, partial [Bacteroidota bacterium]